MENNDLYWKTVAWVTTFCVILLIIFGTVVPVLMMILELYGFE